MALPGAMILESANGVLLGLVGLESLPSLDFRSGPFILQVLVSGIATGYNLSALPALDTYKLLDMVGFQHDSLGVVVLLEMGRNRRVWVMKRSS